MGYLVESFNSNGQPICGSDGTMLAYDLKTLRGTLRRLRLFSWNPRSYKLEVYRQPHEDRYANKYKVLKTTLYVIRNNNAPIQFASNPNLVPH